MKNIDNFLSGLVAESTHIISNPKTIKDLKKRGVNFDERPKKTEDQFLGEEPRAKPVVSC
ncbi:hypothetical protein A3H86_03070 [Candidatus Roizmanbacteria bacterium RIFCSPLOWO2_02_FULL_41_9]|uniref:Uncharacterized protein n=1 Tax=Candidatus Roizmanbacteria bacterium RIFCSPLOWO2_02_FULL_41_9 TaxID=1802077 RepID=A0A1F7JQS1_9BACT|nr:MAG: hypothetical protein A3H86_03070 [Candidatus Roizmanbacteria bacterium RIFCSPLOWO2_02_FULL_41_9]